MTQQTQTKQIPKGWKEEKLGDLADYINGRGFKKSQWKKEGLPIIRIQNLTGRDKRFNYFKGDIEEKNIVYLGDLLMSWSATLDVYIWKQEKSVLNQHIFKVVPKIDKMFLYYLLKTKISEMYSKTHGTGMVHITKGHFENIDVKIPESKEHQSLIVQEIETQFTRLDSAIKSLKAVKQKLEIYRKAVLKEAFENITNYEIKFLGDFDRKGGGTPDTSKKEYWGGNINWITSANIDEKNRITYNKKITKLGVQNSSTNVVPRGSVIIVTRVGLGKVAVTEEDTAFSQDSQGIICNDKTDPYFLMWHINSLANQIISQGQGTTISGITVNKLNELKVKIPSIEEQLSIVSSIESKFSIIDKVEQIVNTSLEKAEKLRKSILKSAFEGKLVNFNWAKNGK